MYFFLYVMSFVTIEAETSVIHRADFPIQYMKINEQKQCCIYGCFFTICVQVISDGRLHMYTYERTKCIVKILHGYRQLYRTDSLIILPCVLLSRSFIRLKFLISSVGRVSKPEAEQRNTLGIHCKGLLLLTYNVYSSHKYRVRYVTSYVQNCHIIRNYPDI